MLGQADCPDRHRWSSLCLFMQQFYCLGDGSSLGSDFVDLRGEVHDRVAGDCLCLPFGGERRGILEPRGEHGEQAADAVPSFVVMRVVHVVSKRYVAREVHVQLRAGRRLDWTSSWKRAFWGP